MPTAPALDASRLPRPIVTDHPEWVALYDLAWRLAAQNRRHSRGRWHMDAAWDPARNFQWVWDTCFMALYCRYAPDQFPGVESLDNFYELQRDDGYISMTYDLNTGAETWPDRINPPLFAWVEDEYYRSTGDASRLPRVLPHLERLMGWIDAHRRTKPHRRLHAVDGPDAGRGESRERFQLYYFRDCGSSGMDDSPRTPREAEAGQFYDWIDLSCQMALSFRRLARLHTVLGQTERAAHWAQRADEVGALINAELWCPRTRFYHDRMLPKNFVAHKTAAGFWPMLAEICPPERVAALVAHLRNRREFNRPTPVPSLSADDLNYDPRGTYWVGGVWAPTNYMVTRGLALVGRGDEAHRIATAYLGALARTCHAVAPHTLWEAYSPESDAPALAAYTEQRVKPDFVGWTGIGPIAMLLENIIGIDAHAAARTVTWDLRLTGEHGVERLVVGPGGQRADLRCAARASARAGADVTVRCDGPLRLILRRGRHTITTELAAGEHRLRG